MTDGKQQGVRDGSKFRGLRPVGRRGFFNLRYDVLVCVAVSRLLSFLVFGVWSRFHFDDSKSRHELLSESAWPDACTLWARWHIPAETGPVGCSGEALVDVEKMANWEEIRRTACVCTHVQPRCHRALPPAWKVIWVWIISVTYSHILVFVSRVMIQKHIFTPIGAEYWQCVCVWCLCVFKGDMCLIFIAYLAFRLHDICMLFIHVAAIWLI